jgi:hypothetical protein
MDQSKKFSMQISLNVLEHLGINLYSNVPAVLSEAVANAWDADAEIVRIHFDGESIIIEDDGEGMTFDEVNERFLRVGYRRRNKCPGPTPKHNRSPMGRKGIGKLSLFSIADIVEVHTFKNGEGNAFRMSLEVMRNEIENASGSYEPDLIEPEPIEGTHGTKIILTGLKKRQTIRTPLALRKRLSRRFSIIGPKNNFEIYVNEKLVKPADRGYYDKIQYLWTYGDQSEVLPLCNPDSHEDRTVHVISEGLEISGWLGTVEKSSDVKDSEGDNLNRIAIFMRGKLAQEDLLDDFTERGVYASYIIGEIHADSLDEDDKPDAATSSRQSLVEDDDRYVKLKEVVQRELKYIQNQWTSLRTKAGAKKAEEIPAIKEWMDSLPKTARPKAQNWVGQLNRVQVDDEDDKKRLYKQAVLAFEFYRYNENIEKLESITDESYQEIVKLFEELDTLEATLYGQIIKQRIAVIQALKEKVDENVRERAIQEHIFDHLWLIDPSWERADSSELMEERVEQLFKGVDADLSDEEKKGRIDIKYRKTAGVHVIIELKRPKRSVSVYELAKQIRKYRNGMKKLLDKVQDSSPVEFVCLLGDYPTEWNDPDGGQRIVTETLNPLNARVVLYESLLDDAFKAYSDYFEKRRNFDKLSKVISAIEDSP